jgi:hypothetical protein
VPVGIAEGSRLGRFTGHNSLQARLGLHHRRFVRHVGRLVVPTRLNRSGALDSRPKRPKRRQLGNGQARRIEQGGKHLLIVGVLSNGGTICAQRHGLR